jgi:hypothetical protein
MLLGPELLYENIGALLLRAFVLPKVDCIESEIDSGYIGIIRNSSV